MATRRKYFNTFFFLNTVTYVPIFLITMCGYDFSFEPNYTIYFFCCFFIYLSIIQAASLFQLDSIYNIFKSKRHLMLLLITPFLICIVCCIPPIWTTRCQWIENNHITDVNLLPFFFLFLPLFIANILISFYTAFKFFSMKYKNTMNK